MNELAWQKMDGLIPAIIQHSDSGEVLMLGYMNQQALTQTQESNLVTFYSRSKQRLWIKGERSGNKLEVISISVDCDGDCLLVLAKPRGPVCHTGSLTCFNLTPSFSWSVLASIEKVIKQRLHSQAKDSYCVRLANAGVKRVAQKVGEEGVEVALAAVDNDHNELINEAADLLFHLLLLLNVKQVSFDTVLKNLQQRQR